MRTKKKKIWLLCAFAISVISCCAKQKSKIGNGLCSLYMASEFDLNAGSVRVFLSRIKIWIVLLTIRSWFPIYDLARYVLTMKAGLCSDSNTLR